MTRPNPPENQAYFLEKHRLLSRLTHWINFPVLGVMIWSGLLIYWAHDIYKIQIGDVVLFAFFPESWYKALDMKFHLATGMNWHFVFMWLFMLNGLVYVIYTIASGAWRELTPDKNTFKDSFLVVAYDLGLRKTQPDFDKYNAAQKAAYFMIIVMGTLSIASGWAIYKPIQANWLMTLLGGYEFARVIHFTLTMGYLLFFVIHVAQVIRAGWKNFASMVTGLEKIDAPKTTSI
jgi:thiosulfate reductase cytochrome b subunit